MLLTEHLSTWLNGLDTRFRGSLDFVQRLTLFASESATMGFNSDHVKVGWFPPGFYIIEQGEPATSLYLILSGQAEVFQEDADGSLQKVADREPAEFVGETGLACGKPRNANIIAKDSVTCLVFSPAEPTAFAGRGEEA
jgi:CRP-like cAMP-binding protein|tara:strand:+ start:292 stop:708 length:417 start_codon:yes stop_codon:yes gene_type:complete